MPVLTRKTPKKASQSTRMPLGARGPIELPEGMWDRIREKAYELWEQRGCREGDALQDWLDAEEIVMESIHEARE